jgi:glucose-1-phosphate cytidylyltransferase
VLARIDDDDTSLEHDVLPRLVAEGQLAAYRHESFWQCMDTMRDRRLLESLWSSGNPPWLSRT